MKTQLQAPLFRLGICFGGGIFLEKYLDTPYYFLLVPFILLFAILVYRDDRLIGHRYEVIAALSIYLLFISLGFTVGQLSRWDGNPNKLAVFECNVHVLSGKVISPSKENPFGYQIWMEMEAIKMDSLWIKIRGRAQVNIKAEISTDISLGDRVVLDAFIKPIFSKGNSYHDYLLSKGIEHLAYTRSIRAVEKASGWMTDFICYQQQMGQYMDEQMLDPELSGLAKAMFLGEKSSLEKPIRKAFATAGLSHLLAISGMHVGIIFLCLSMIFFPLQLFPGGRRVKYILILFFLILYMFLTGASPAVVRAVLMLSALLIYKICHQRYQLLNLLAISAWIQMLYCPEVLFEIGFQLSYIAVLGLILFMPLYQSFTQSPYKWLNILNGWVGVSIIATCCTAPLTLYYFGVFPTYFLLANVLSSTLTFLVVLSGFLWGLFLHTPVLNESLADVSEVLLKALYLLADEISQLPYAEIKDFSLTDKGIWIVFIELICALLLMMLPRMFFKFKSKSKSK